MKEGTYGVYLEVYIKASLGHVPGGSDPNLSTEVDQAFGSNDEERFAAALGISHARKVCNPDTKEEFALRLSGVKSTDK